MRDFPAVIVTLTDRVRSTSPDVIVINLRHRNIERGSRMEFFNSDLPRHLEFDLVACLIAARGAPLTHSAIYDILYGDREDGGPLCAHKNIFTMLWKRRNRLANVGVSVENWYNVGFRACDLWQSAIRRAA